ncbi:hypothetical protein QU38_00960, partial [Staphylococcus aureus]
HAVDVLQAPLAIIDIAAVLRREGERAQRQIPFPDRQVDDAAAVPAQIAVLGGRAATPDLAAPRPEIGRARHHPHHAAERAGAIERALRPFEHFDPADIVELQVRIGGAVGDPTIAPILADGRLGGADEARIGDTADE